MPETVTVREASPGDADFHALAAAVYRGDPHSIPPSPEAARAALERPEHRGRQRLLVAYEDGRPAARLAALVSPALDDPAGRPYGLIGHFEAQDRPAAVGALFAAAVAWLGERGAGEVVGPMDGDTWHRYRVNAGPFTDPPFLLEPYNPPYYPRLWEEAGFVVLERYASTRVDDPEAVAAHLARRAEGALGAGYRLRPLAAARLDEELRLVYRLSCDLFAGNFLYTPISEAEFLALYRGMGPLLDPRLVWFAEAPGGEEVGFLFAYPDLFAAVAAMRGRRGLLARLRFARRRRRVATVNFKTLGVLAAHRRSGVAAALFHRAYEAALGAGFTAANHCLFKDDNPSARLDGGHGRPLRSYLLYRYAGGEVR